MSNVIFQKILLVIPITGFMLVIDPATWPFIIAVSLPLIAARYLPTRIWLLKNSEEDRVNKFSFAKKLVPLLLVGATIFSLNTTPKKLVDVKKCEYELAGKLDKQIPSMDRASCRSVIFILKNQVEL
ncbi:MAG: hypothetical protein KDC80_25880 [Saprospiraceae bacterium]|nr:hypothetical protein [Saprospiraceae bacterium]